MAIRRGSPLSRQLFCGFSDRGDEVFYGAVSEIEGFGSGAAVIGGVVGAAFEDQGDRVDQGAKIGDQVVEQIAELGVGGEG